LGEHSDCAVLDGGDFDGLIGRRLDATSGRDLLKFKH